MCGWRLQSRLGWCSPSQMRNTAHGWVSIILHADSTYTSSSMFIRVALCLHYNLHIDVCRVCGDHQLSEICRSLANVLLDFEQGDISLQGRLPSRWKSLVTRDSSGAPSKQGQVWACPYRWGSTLIAYRRDALLRCASSILLLFGLCHALGSLLIGLLSLHAQGDAISVLPTILPAQCRE